VAGAALTHGLNANLLRKWIKDAALSSQRKRPALPALAKLLAVTHGVAPRLAVPSDGYLEILVRGVTLRVHGRIDPTMLRHNVPDHPCSTRTAGLEECQK
jgi:transposase-like protein